MQASRRRRFNENTSIHWTPSLAGLCSVSCEVAFHHGGIRRSLGAKSIVLKLILHWNSFSIKNIVMKTRIAFFSPFQQSIPAFALPFLKLCVLLAIWLGWKLIPWSIISMAHDILQQCIHAVQDMLIWSLWLNSLLMMGHPWVYLLLWIVSHDRGTEVDILLTKQCIWWNAPM